MFYLYRLCSPFYFFKKKKKDEDSDILKTGHAGLYLPLDIFSELIVYHFSLFTARFEAMLQFSQTNQFKLICQVELTRHCMNSGSTTTTAFPEVISSLGTFDSCTTLQQCTPDL